MDKKSKIEIKVNDLIGTWKGGRFDKADEFLIGAEALKKKIPSKNAALHNRLDEAMEEAVEILDKLGQELLRDQEAKKRESKSQNNVRLAVGDVILEPYGMTAIVIRECEPPADAWFVKATDSYRDLHGRKQFVRWFEAFPLTGGSIVAAEPLSKHQRKASAEDAKAAYAAANGSGRAALAAIFPNMKMGF